MSEMFNRYAIGVRAHADGVGVKQANALGARIAQQYSGQFSQTQPELAIRRIREAHSNLYLSDPESSHMVA